MSKGFPFLNFRYFYCLKNLRSQLLNNGLGVTFGSQLLLEFPASLLAAIRLREVFFELEISNSFLAIVLNTWKVPHCFRRSLFRAFFFWLFLERWKEVFHTPWQFSSKFSFFLVKQRLYSFSEVFSFILLKSYRCAINFNWFIHIFISTILCTFYYVL